MSEKRQTDQKKSRNKNKTEWGEAFVCMSSQRSIIIYPCFFVFVFVKDTDGLAGDAINQATRSRRVSSFCSNSTLSEISRGSTSTSTTTSTETCRHASLSIRVSAVFMYLFIYFPFLFVMASFWFALNNQ